ncbi:tripartite tricarboxylate transporter permease [Halomicroarcula sp. S1AR25-4]|uniref:tripartite tricarboxylate transporter permease n=1 Tax=Haloarcula sp. S1AR25-4 TaxID=2950538 RepID=UPI00287488EB|nr:tripartite tricarboxylate transporter permease [Halomicroarcula sp. S1AR25-4]MDS0280439.1 tripartite tricarboxylate transporter permease [Halomicroarcula sp. S1AR25-4]
MLPVRLTAEPLAVAGVVLAIAGGVCLGCASGLVPGLHANTLALLLAATAGQIPGPRVYVGAAMLAAGVTHTFLDVVPALALGVPDPAMAAGALPGHRLVVEGRGREALRLSALGSAGAVLLAAPLALPVTAVMTRLYPVVSAHLSLVLAGIAALLVVTERGPRRRVGALVSLGSSGGLGLLFLDAPLSGVLPVADVLVPLFAGLFGAPVLLAAIEGDGVPPQADPAVTTPRRTVATLATVGTLCGAVVGYLPGVSSAIAATLALGVTSTRGPRAFVVTTSGVNTATAVFALFALVTFGDPRTGVLVALDRANVPLALPVLVTAVVVAAVAGALLVPWLGDRYLRTVGRLDPAWLSVSVLAALLVLSGVFAGHIGVAAFGAATLAGHVPPHFDCRRATLMGVLLVPLML